MLRLSCGTRIPTVVVFPSLSLARLQQASPGLFPVSAPPGPWRISPVSCMLGKGVLPPLQILHSFQPTGASAPVDQLRL
jgi:hypothetical protein